MVLCLALLVGAPAAAQDAAPSAPREGGVAIGPVTGDVPLELAATLATSLATVVQESGRTTAPGAQASSMLWLEARTAGDGVALVLTLVETGGKEAARLETVATRASADSQARALARAILTRRPGTVAPPSPVAPPPPAPIAGPPPAPVAPPPPEPVAPPVPRRASRDACESHGTMIGLGVGLSAVGLTWFTYEAIALYSDLNGVFGGSLWSYAFITAGAIVSNKGYGRREDACLSAGFLVDEGVAFLPWGFTIGTIAMLVGGVLVGGIGGMDSLLGDGNWEYYETAAHSMFIVGAALELANMVGVRPFWWQAAIDRAAAGSAQGATVMLIGSVARDSGGATVPTLGLAGSF
jgi:hypothetical protein